MVELPSECLHVIVQRLPPNCIPLAIRQLSKELQQQYLQHTTVHAAGYLPAWAVLEALPHMDQKQKQQLMAALARRGELDTMRLLVQHQQAQGGPAVVTTSALRSAAAGGHLDVVRWLVEEQHCPRDDDWACSPCSDAAGSGHIHVLTWLRSQEPPFHWGFATSLRAARGGHVVTLEWLRTNGCNWVKGVRAAAAFGGQQSALMWLREQGCRWDKGCCVSAAAGGHLGVLQLLRQHGCPWDGYATRQAAAYGHVDVLQWLEHEGCPWDPMCWSDAVIHGHARVLDLLLDKGCPGAANDLMRTAVHHKQRHVLLWLRVNLRPWDAHVCEAAAMCNDLDLLQWLREQVPPCPWDEGVSDAACSYALHGKPACLQWLLDNGCPYHASLYGKAQQHPALQHVRFPVRRSKRLQKFSKLLTHAPVV